jgi:replicative DNA helicase
MTALYTQTHADTERAIVHTCLMAPERLADLDLEPHHFAGPLWRAAWRVMRESELQCQPIDPILVADTLREQGNKLVTTTDLIGTPETVGVVEALAERVKEAHIARSVAFACSQVLGSISDGKRGSEALDDALAAISAIDTGQAHGAMNTREIILARMQELRDIHARKMSGEQAMTGIPTGLVEIDELTGGLQRGTLTVVGARPGMGKSAFGVAIARGASQTVGVHSFSLEDIREAYADRLIAAGCRVPAESLRRVEFNAGDLDRMKTGLPRLLEEQTWLVDDRSGVTAEEVVRSVRRARKANNTQIVLVDYLQLMKASSIGNRAERIGHSLQVLADAAKQDRMSYVVFSQLNRECERRDDKRPMLSDLKESGDIEDKAKLVLFLYRGERYGDRESNPTKVEVIIAKNNQGRTGIAEANWDAPTIRIY